MEDQEELNSSENFTELKIQKKQDPFTRLMFGSRRDHPHHNEHQEQTQNPSTIDYEALMMNVDLFIESVRGLKPLVQKFQPYIAQIWKKK